MEKDAVRINASTRIFQKRLDEALQGLSGVFTIADDILVVGNETTKHESRQDHDQKLTATLLDRCRQQNIKLDKDECKLMK